MSSSTVQILVDDFDPRITYSPADKWIPGGGPYEHNSTTHAFIEGTGSFSFNFNGTGIVVQTTAPFIGENDSWAEVACKVDGVDIDTHTPPDASYHHVQCSTSSPLSSNTEHVLQVEVDRTKSAGPPFYLDYLIYDAEVEEEGRLVGPAGGNVRVVVDDKDERIVYGGPEGAWSEGGSPIEQGGTTHLTRTGGATATYKFFGTSIQVYGTLSDPASNTPFTASFKIDDQSPISYTPSTQFEGLVYKTRFFQSSVLEEGEHTLVITDTTENASEFILDFLVQSVSPVSLLTKPVSPESNPGSDSDSNNSISSNQTKSNTGLIAGATVGGVLALLFILLGLFFWTRRRRSRRGVVDLGNRHGEPAEKAFLRPAPPVNTHSDSSLQMSWAPGAVSESGSDAYTHHGPASSAITTNPSTYASNSAPASSSSSSAQPLLAHHTAAPLPRKGGQPPPRPVSAAPPVQHEDGGVRLQGQGQGEEEQMPSELPPVYRASYT